MKVRTWLHGHTDLFKDFPADEYTDQGPDWNREPKVFDRLISELKPATIIEVGTFYGGSAIYMGRLVKELKLSTEIVCVDTWLGTKDGMKPEHPDYQFHHRVNGMPTIYEHFLANVIREKLQKIITPFPQTSVNAARALAEKGVRAELIYVDAAHEYDDVVLDLELYSKLLAPGGVILCDDMNHGQVASAVHDWAAMNSFNVRKAGEVKAICAR